ncbi:MAG: glycosyltransferase [Gemmatimonadaceae bacterium]
MSGSVLGASGASTAGDEIAISFVGVMLPDSAAELMQPFPQAGQLFQTRLLRSIADAGMSVSAVFLQRPVPSFPVDRRLCFRAESGRIAGEFSATMLPFVNWGPLKTATISASLFISLLVWAWQHRSARARAVLLYNVAAPPGIVSIAAARLMRARVFAVVADVQVPGAGLVPPSLLRRLEFSLQVRTLPLCDGLVVLTKRIAEDFAPAVPNILMEGAAPDEVQADAGAGVTGYGDGIMASPLAPEPAGPIVLMYAGGLSEFKGVPLLLETMGLLRNRDYRLWITGDGPLRSDVERAASADERIVYWGFPSYPEVLQRMREATILVNPHATDLASARYVFPSKLIEYLATGTPVVTTLSTPEVESEYGHVAFVAPSAVAEAFAATIDSVAALSADERRERGRRAQQYVMSHKSWRVQGKRVADFIRRSLNASVRPAGSDRPLHAPQVTRRA